MSGCEECQRSLGIQHEAEVAWRAEGRDHEWIADELATWQAEVLREHDGGGHETD